jgi:aminomethyltransferase
MDKETTLYQKHVELGGKMVSFAGYRMPVHYPAGVIAEHMAVRTAAGLFDVSHMGEAVLSGPGALPSLQKLLTNDFSELAVGACRYSPMCNTQGGVVDDLIVCRLADDRYLMVINAANRTKDVEWIKRNMLEGTQCEDVSDQLAQLAVQGPRAEEIVAKLAGDPQAVAALKYYTFKEGIAVSGIPCLVSRTGYTGEDGFELYCDAGRAPQLWDALLEQAGGEGLLPCGLGARDTLRLEAAMPLYGHEMNEEITPLEASLGIFVKRDKPDFNGKEALMTREIKRRRSGLHVTGRGIAREGCEVWLGSEQIGVVTSGTQLPYVGWPGALALLDVNHRELGTKVEVDIRGRRVEAEVVKVPFYKRGGN